MRKQINLLNNTIAVLFITYVNLQAIILNYFFLLKNWAK